MFTEEFPSKKIGCLAPRHVSDNEPYEFYRLAPPGVMLVMISCGLNDFTREDVERVCEPLESLLDKLVERDVDIVVQSGVPLPLLIGLEAHDALLRRIETYTRKPATSQLVAVIAALKHLGVKRVLIANKWTDAMNAMLAKFLERDGIAVAGIYNKSLSPAEFSKIPARDSARLAYELGRQAFAERPEADGLFIGGGNWLSQPVCEALEAETGKPVVCNLGAMMWSVLHRLGVWQPMPGHGRLLADGGD